MRAGFTMQSILLCNSHRDDPVSRLVQCSHMVVCWYGRENSGVPSCCHPCVLYLLCVGSVFSSAGMLRDEACLSRPIVLANSFMFLKITPMRGLLKSLL